MDVLPSKLRVGTNDEERDVAIFVDFVHWPGIGRDASGFFELLQRGGLRSDSEAESDVALKAPLQAAVLTKVPNWATRPPTTRNWRVTALSGK